MDRRLPSVALALSAVLTACSPPAVDVEAEGEVLMQLSREWSDLVATGDMDAIMAGWAEDAVMMPPGTPPLEGKAAIRAYVEAGQQLPGFEISWEPMTVHVAASGDMAYMIERNVTSAHDTLGNPVTTHGKVVTAMLGDGHPEPARGMAKKIIRIYPEAVRTLCTLTWLDLASRHTAMALVHLQEYVDAAKSGHRGHLASKQILQMARAVTHREFLEAAAKALEELEADDDAARVRDWATSDGGEDAVVDPDELATHCMRAAVGSNAARRAEGAPA